MLTKKILKICDARRVRANRGAEYFFKNENFYQQKERMISVLGKDSICHDLSYPLGSDTIFWPGGESFKLCMGCSEDPVTKDFYAAGVITCAEHGKFMNTIA